MIKKPASILDGQLPGEERFTSLQPTYEDSVPPSDEDDWDDDAAC
jgi:hypothetical protein